MAEHEGEGGGVLRELLAIFGFEVETKELEKGESALGKFVEDIKKTAEAFVGAFIGKEIFEFAESSVHAMTEIEHAAAKLGISAESVQQFQFAAKSMGMEAESMLNLMGRLQVSQQAAAQGGAQQQKAFSALGVSVKDSNGHFKDADQLFLDVADGITKQTDASKQAALATQLFGRRGRELLPFLKEGSEGFEDLREQFKQLGGGYTEKAIEEGKKFEKQTAKLDLVTKGLKSTILSALLPVITKIVGAFTVGVKWLSEWAAKSNIVQAALVTLGGVATVFAIKMAIAFAPFFLIAAAIAAVILVVDDLITLFQGGQSAIGESVDKAFGKGSSIKLVEQLRNIWYDIKDTIDDIGDSIALAQKGLEALIAGATGMSSFRAATGQTGQLDREMTDITDRMSARAQKRALREHPELAPSVVPPALLTSLPTEMSVPPMLARNTAAGGREGDINIHLHGAPGMTKKEAAELIGSEVRKVNKAERREAAMNFQRSGS